MGSNTVPARIGGTPIKTDWANDLRTAILQDFLARNSSGQVSSGAGSLGSISARWLNAYLENLRLYGNGNLISLKAPSGLPSSYGMTLPAALPGSGRRAMLVDSSGNVVFDQVVQTDLAPVVQTRFSPVPVTATIASPGVLSTAFSSASCAISGTNVHPPTPGLFWAEVGDPVIFSTTGTLPTPLVPGTTYYISGVDSESDFRISATLGGADLTFSGGSGTFSFARTGHGLSVGDRIVLATTGALPTGFSPYTAYYVSATPTTNTLKLSATLGGADINTSGSQSGSHTIAKVVAAGGMALSRSCLVLLNTNTSIADMQNLSVTIESTGRPIDVGLQADGQIGAGSMLASMSTNNPGTLQILVSGSLLSKNSINSAFRLETNFTILLPAGVYTFAYQWASAGSQISARFMRAFAFEK